jgi:sugar lactone lactonase YvrE
MFNKWCLLVGIIIIIFIIASAGCSKVTANELDKEIPKQSESEIGEEELTEVEGTEDMLAPATEQISVPQVCADIITPPSPFGTFEPVLLDFAQPDYAAEWFVAPGVFNMPQEVLLSPQGNLIVHAVRSGILFSVSDNGSISQIANNLRGYLGTVDKQGNIYMFWHPDGCISRISHNGVVTVLTESPELEAACDSGFGIGPDGNLYTAINHCENTSDLYQITPLGKITKVASSIPWMSALRTLPDGRFLGVGQDIYEISIDNFLVTVLAPTPEGGVSPGGMAVDDRGNIYISNGPRAPSGDIYQITPDGTVSLFAQIPLNGLSGIEWWPVTGEIVGGQLRQGALIAVSMDGTLREIVPGNGIVTPMGIAFSPCGDLAVTNDDGGMMALINMAGEASWFFDYPSFTPPTSFVAFARDGTLFISVGAPSMPEEILKVSPAGTPITFSKSNMPCGLAYSTDGTLFVAETSTGCIMKINSDGLEEVFVEGLKYPQDLVLDAEGNLYVINGPADFIEDSIFKTPNYGDTIMCIKKDGSIHTIANIKGVAALAISPEGDIFAASGPKIMKVSDDGSITLFSDGLNYIRGLAFNLAGNLYVSDADLNGILRIGGFPQGTISGTVMDSSGIAIAEARVQVLSDQPIVVGELIETDTKGHFSLTVAPRNYDIIITAQGYETEILENIQVTIDQDKILQVQMAE